MALKKDEIVRYFLACKKECEDETKSIRDVWEDCLAQYLCKKDFSRKEDWQYKVYTPISKPKIKKAVRLIKKNMITTGDYFDFINPPRVPEKQRLCSLTKRALRLYLDQASFIDNFSDALESGFTLSMMILKFWVAETEDAGFSVDADKGEIVYSTSPKLKCKAINPFNFWFTKDGSITIEDEWLTLPEFREIIKQSPDIYNQKEVKRFLNTDFREWSDMTQDDQQRLRKLGLDDTGNPYRKELKLSHFYGPVINKKNEIVIKNAQMLIVNDKYLILGPRENPFWHKKSPYIYDSPLKVLFRHVGKGLTEDVRGVEDAIVDFVNLQLDNLLWKVLGIHEIDELAFSEFGKSDLQELYPGKFVRRRPGYQGDAYRFHDIGVDPAKAMAMLQELKGFHDEEHGVTAYVEAMPGASGEKASIYAGKRQTALGDFQAIALDIERRFFVKCLDMARDLMIQYLMDVDNPDLHDIFRENEFDLAELTPEEKKAMIVTDVDFIGKGISSYFEKEQQLQKIGAYVKMLNAMPAQAQLYPNWPAIIKRFNEIFSFDNPDEMIHSDREVAELQAQMQQAQQQQLMQQFKLMQIQHAQELEKIDRKNMPKLVDISKKYQDKEIDRRIQLIEKALDFEKDASQIAIKEENVNQRQPGPGI